MGQKRQALHIRDLWGARQQEHHSMGAGRRSSILPVLSARAAASAGDTGGPDGHLQATAAADVATVYLLVMLHKHHILHRLAEAAIHNDSL